MIKYKSFQHYILSSGRSTALMSNKLVQWQNSGWDTSTHMHVFAFIPQNVLCVLTYTLWPSSTADWQNSRLFLVPSVGKHFCMFGSLRLRE